MSIRILTGDCRSVLKTLPDESVNCVVTSPPYFNLRSYLPDDHPDKALEVGLEETPEAFVAALVETFREIRRVLRGDGVCWINIGDSYASSTKGSGGTGKSTLGTASGGNAISPEGQIRSQERQAMPVRRMCLSDGLKPKDLIGVPWMTAFALRADGWWLRGDHIWGKPNSMPESVTDRPARAHEYVFLLTKSERYWFDNEAVRTAPKASTVTRLAQDVENQKGSERANGGAKTGAAPVKDRQSDKQRGHTRRHAGFNDRWDEMERSDQIAAGANLRSIWWVSPAQYRGSHFAVMPDLVAEICIRSGCPEGGVVLDPFFGAGTTGLVADRLGRNCIGIDLNPANATQAADRIRADANLLAEISVEVAA